jgi:predicted dienelactone hydrolase
VRFPRLRPAALAASLAFAAGLALTACGSQPPAHWSADPAATPSTGDILASAAPTASASPVPSTSASPSASPAPPRAPSKTFAVATRQLSLARGSRTLPTTVWYPATSTKANSASAAGRFPVVVFSHGLHGLPAYYQQLTSRIAAAGFVVAAPAYPFTNANASPFDAGDMGNQPADASAVVSAVLKLGTTSGDRFFGHIDAAHVGAAGHSAGGFTTAGLLANKRDTRIKAAVVIAGGPMGAFTGARTPVLFVHGDKDPTVAYNIGHDAYARLSWPKAFLTEVGQGHGEYLGTGAKGFDQMMKTMLDFFRWALYGDATAKGRLKADASKSGVTRWEAKL